jgi:hypothetical protein
VGETIEVEKIQKKVDREESGTDEIIDQPDHDGL